MKPPYMVSLIEASRMPYLLSLLLLIFPQVLFAQTEIDAAYNKMLQKKYQQGFPVISTEDAQVLINNSEVIFLDIREPVEYALSHIPGAINVGYQKVDWEKIATLDKAAKIIVYCSIGIRSQEIGKQLQQKGFSDVSNLYGGIFLWADQGRKMQDNQGNKIAKVHGYNWWWGRWVKKAEVVYP